MPHALTNILIISQSLCVDFVKEKKTKIFSLALDGSPWAALFLLKPQMRDAAGWKIVPHSQNPE